MSPSGTVGDQTGDFIAITRLQAAYGDSVTRRDWVALAGLFELDAPITIDTARGAPIEVRGGPAMGEFIAAAIERFRFFEFVPLNTVLDIDTVAGEATGRLYIQELRSDVADDRFSTAYGLYTDHYRRSGGRWRFSARHYRSMARTSATDGRTLDVIE